jgi:hypothetical protein
MLNIDNLFILQKHIKFMKKAVLFSIALLIILIMVFSPVDAARKNIKTISKKNPAVNSAAPVSDYSMIHYVNGVNVEERLYYKNQHFLSIITTNGIFDIRPHPGVDINGWGSSLYMQPFFLGANLRYSAITNKTIKNDGIELSASGLVSKQSGSYGTWNFTMFFSYSQASKQVLGIGQYKINLTGALSESTGDLNLYKLASNYLDDVPILGGCMGDTGDMKYANVSGKYNFIWFPELIPAHFPGDISDSLSVDVVGNLNNVDTAAQGYAPISPAYKPEMKVVLNSNIPGISMIFGGIFDTSKSQQFWADNIGITPLILKTSHILNYDFNVSFYSSAIQGDGVDINRDGIVDVGDLGILSANYGQNCSFTDYCNSADINRDLIVDVGDLGILSANYGKTFWNCV